MYVFVKTQFDCSIKGYLPYHYFSVCDIAMCGLEYS